MQCLSTVDIDPATLQLPRSVSFVSFGHKTSAWARAAIENVGYINDRKWFVDLRDFLDDPLGSDRVRHGENGSSEKTQLAVMQQPQFAGVIESVVGQVFEMLAEECDHLLIPLACKTGDHRAYVSAEVASSIVNSFFDGRNGQKLFESQCFHLSTCTSGGDARSLLTHAWDWADSATAPWAAIPLTSDLFGKKACLRSRSGSATIDRLEAFLVDSQSWWDSQITPGLSPLPEGPSPEGTPPSPSPESTPPPPSPSPPRRPTVKAPDTMQGAMHRLQAKRKQKDIEAPHVMKASSDHD